MSRLTYAAPIWSHRINFKSKAKLRSIYYKIIRTMIRDFDFKLNRSTELRIIGMEDIDKILFNRTSYFVLRTSAISIQQTSQVYLFQKAMKMRGLVVLSLLVVFVIHKSSSLYSNTKLVFSPLTLVL